MAILEKLKSKPVFWGGAAIVVIFGVYYVLSSGASSSTSTGSVDASSVAAANALQLAQLQANQQGAQTSAAVQANQDNIAGQISLAQIQTDSQNFIANLEYQLGIQQTNAAAQDSALVSTLTAQVQTAAINAQTEQQSIAANESIVNTQTLANTLVQQAQINAGVAESAISSQCHGFGCLF